MSISQKTCEIKMPKPCYEHMEIITVMWHVRHDVSNHRQIDFVPQCVQADHKLSIKDPPYHDCWSIVRERYR